MPTTPLDPSRVTVVFWRAVLALALSAVVLSSRALGLGLGEVQLQSSLGQPLRADIPLLAAEDLSEGQLKASIGSQADYDRLGVERQFLHTQIRIDTLVRAGQPVALRLSTSEPVREPYLNFVLTIRWPEGTFSREFTLFIDPPGAAAVPAAAEGRGQSLLAQARAADARAAARTAAPGPDAPGPVDEAATGPGAQTYVTRGGDTLWSVARRLAPPGQSIEQTMAALVAANPQAFVDGDPDRLKQGATIRYGAQRQAVAPPAVRERVAATLQEPAEVAPSKPSRLHHRVSGVNIQVDVLNRRIEANKRRMARMEATLANLIDDYQRWVATELSVPPERATLEGVDSLLAGLDIEARSSPSVLNRAEALSEPAPATDPAASAATPRAGTAQSYTTVAVWWRTLLAVAVLLLILWLGREHIARLVALVRGDEALADVGRTEAFRGPDGHSFGAAFAGDAFGGNAVGPGADARQGDANAAPRSALENRVQPQLAGGREELDADDEPLVIAGAYSAFGQYREAEHILTQALAHQTDNNELKLALLDLYGRTEQTALFQRLMAELAASDDPDVQAELQAIRQAFA